MDNSNIPNSIKDALKTIEKCTNETIKRLDKNSAPTRDCTDIHCEFKQAVELSTDGKNTVILDDIGMPSVMVKIEAMLMSDLIEGAPKITHPAFFMNGKPLEYLYISKYQNIVRRSRGYSLPMQDAADNVSFGEAVKYCCEKGEGWGLTTFALRAAIALLSKKLGTLPHGNNFDGKDYFHLEEAGIPAQNSKVMTGSGPLSWSHNGKSDGIYDMNGNLNEWDSGLRLIDGQIQLIPGADSLLPDADLSQSSAQWKAILPNGSYADPETPGALYYSGSGDKIILTYKKIVPKDEKHNCAFRDITADKGLTISDEIKALTLYPDTHEKAYGNSWRWINTMGECLPLCGGASHALDHAGIFFMGLTYPRGHKYTLSGFRSAYVPPQKSAKETP